MYSSFSLMTLKKGKKVAGQISRADNRNIMREFLPLRTLGCFPNSSSPWGCLTLALPSSLLPLTKTTVTTVLPTANGAGEDPAGFWNRHTSSSVSSPSGKAKDSVNEDSGGPCSTSHSLHPSSIVSVRRKRSCKETYGDWFRTDMI